jgi:hypothetical protein
VSWVYLLSYYYLLKRFVLVVFTFSLYTTVYKEPTCNILYIRRITIGFNADLYPAFYLNAVPDPGSQSNLDPFQFVATIFT